MGNNNNNRRQTLGGLSPAVLNSRQSLGPARIAMDSKGGGKGSNLFGGRLSLAGGRLPGNGRMAGPPSVMPRRSSAHAKGGGPKQDPRRLGDKDFKENCIKMLISYLSCHNYDQPITAKMLYNPMGKDVTHIMQFLMKQVDPHLKNLGKMEDEVPAFFKRMRYPFAISKSALFAVGSPHTWPGLLAAMVWLCELLYYEEKAEQLCAETFDEKARAESEFFGYVAQAYRHFLAGDDDECARVEQQQLGAFQEKMQATRARSEQLQQEKEQLQARLDEMRSSKSPLQDAREKHEVHVSDRATFLRKIGELQAQKKALERKVAERAADLSTKQQNLASVEQECEDLRANIAAQTISRDDVIRMNNERAKQEERLSALASQRETLEARVMDQELSCESHLDELDASLQTYHTAADRLQLIPVNAKRAAGIQYEITLNRDGCTALELLNVDLKAVVKPGLMRVRDERASTARKLANEALSLQGNLDAAQNTLSERAEENTALAAQVEKLEKQLASVKEVMDAELEAKAAEAEQLRGKVAELRSATSHTVADSEEKIMALQVQAEELMRANENEAEQLNYELSEALKALLDHKLYLQQTLENVHGHVQSVYSQVAALQV